eukprot:gene9205-9991_t
MVESVNTVVPSAQPTVKPTFTPTVLPTFQPTVAPTISLNIWTIVGAGNSSYFGDGGPATQARLKSVHHVWVDSLNRLFMSDYDACTIRVVSLATGIINRFAGLSSCSGTNTDNVPATSTYGGIPEAIAGDTYGNIYYTDVNTEGIRKVSAQGILSTLAGSGSSGYVDGAGKSNVYISEYAASKIRVINTAGIVTSYAGTGSSGYNGDGIAATLAMLKNPHGI